MPVRNTIVMLLFGLPLSLLGCPDESPQGDDDVSGDDDTTASADDDDDALDDQVDPSTVEGNDYLWDLYSASFNEPFDGGILKQWMGGNPNVLFHVSGIDEGSNQIQAYAALVTRSGDEYVQYLCQPTIQLGDPQPGLWENPSFEFGPVEAEPEDSHEFYTAHIALLFADKTITGRFTQPGDAISDGTIDGTMDTRYLDESIDPGAEEGIACEVLAEIDIDCIECPDGSGPYCLVVSAVGIEGQVVAVTAEHPETGEALTGLTEVTSEMVEAWEAGSFCP